jgi:hypothetical protein
MLPCYLQIWVILWEEAVGQRRATKVKEAAGDVVMPDVARAADNIHVSPDGALEAQ